MELKPVGRVRSPFGSKFGVPRQSGLVPEVRCRLVFEPEYRSRDCLRGVEGFSHLWLIWGFSENEDRGWSPTVRPPRLGGNERVGVFASRSPFRPNSIGLSCVELAGIDLDDPEGPVLLVRGADLMDGTPILDVKPYLPYADSRPEARGGFTDSVAPRRVRCVIPDGLLRKVPEEKRAALIGVLEQDPRPTYQDDPERVYGFRFAGLEVRFTVAEGVLSVTEIL
jgi:tRNA-Thr(GGU) m(6)t(6)A37 methyltransferase TsaA